MIVEVIRMIYVIALLIIANAALLLYMRKKNEEEKALLIEKIESGLELKRTMAMGLYYRFNFPRIEDSDGNKIFTKGTELFIKQLPYEFEDFVAAVFHKKFQGDMFVTSRSGDYGVDFEHMTSEGLFLGQAKAEREDLSFESIAILHSNMVKRNAAGGYLVTTSNFSRAAQDYAEDLNIQLIDGVQLVEYWLDSMNNQIYAADSELIASEYM